MDVTQGTDSSSSGPSSRSALGHLDHAEDEIVLRLHRGELALRRRYEMISVLNDLLIGLWFLVGSFLFFSTSLSYYGTWLFVIGSVEMLIRPGIRFVRRLHLSRLHPGTSGLEAAGQDF